MSLLVLCPTRGRPSAVRETLASFLETKEILDTQLLFVVNDDEDPEQYKDAPHLSVSKKRWMNEVLAEAVLRTKDWDIDYYGFIGDDNRFITKGWDKRVVEVLHAQGGGFAYCNDLARNDIPTHVFVSSRIVRALGWFGLPGARHLYLDNTWAVLGEGADCLYYIRDTIIEHRHPLYGSGKWDDSYRESNAQSVYDHDRQVFERWLKEDAEKDIQTVRDTIGT